MNVSITVPDDVGHRLKEKWKDIPRRALEALAIEAYKSSVVTDAEVQSMLNLSSRWEVEEFLKRSQAYVDYTEEDLQHDIDILDKLSAR